jgi:hypothetical protein
MWPFKPKVYICTVELTDADGVPAGWYWAEMSDRQRRMSVPQRKVWLRSDQARLHGPFTTMADCHNAQYDVVQDRYRSPVRGKLVTTK